MEYELSLKLSDKMLDTLKVMKEHNGKLIRWKHGFWTYEGAISEYENTILKYPNFYNEGNFLIPHSVAWDNMELAKKVPICHCDVKTLRALSKRKLVELNEVDKICKLINSEGII